MPDLEPDPQPLHGRCHCGAVRFTLSRVPESATACNCSSCHRWGGLWAYGRERDEIVVSGPTATYVRGPNLAYHFCATCACVAYWRTLQPGTDGLHAMAVNLRLAEADAVAHLPIDHFEGLVTFTDLPRDGRCVRDLWF